MTGHEHHPDPISDEEATSLLAPLGTAAPSPQARQRAASALTSRLAVAPRGFSLRHRLLIGASALVAPLMAITAVGALSGGSFHTPVDLVTSAASSVTGDTHSTVSASEDEDDQGEDVDDDQGEDINDDENVDEANGETPGAHGHGHANDATPDADETPADGETPTPGDTPTATDPHANGHGCDDVIFAGEDGAKVTGQGGPIGCTVGNSGDHRQNGAHATETGTPTPDEGETPTAEDTPTEGTDPHANGHGCDDVLFADGTKTTGPGGPIGCDVGNSGDHRQNGAHGGDDSTPTPGGETPTPGAATTSESHGNSGNAPGHSGDHGKPGS